MASNFISEFIENFPKEYDLHQMSFNVLSISHLCKDVFNLQVPMENYSAFKFENFLQFLKKVAKTSSTPIQEISNRYEERIRFNVPLSFQKEDKTSKLNSDGTYKYFFITITNSLISNRIIYVSA